MVPVIAIICDIPYSGYLHWWFTSKYQFFSLEKISSRPWIKVLPIKKRSVLRFAFLTWLVSPLRVARLFIGLFRSPETWHNLSILKPSDLTTLHRLDTQLVGLSFHYRLVAVYQIMFLTRIVYKSNWHALLENRHICLHFLYPIVLFYFTAVLLDFHFQKPL